tara:strand:- start:4929 stop:5768 length:840 start_codon:yes stop_codon:yes gene_type:complete
MSKLNFSILMATYHADDPVFLGDAIDSILLQSILPDQFVFVIDGPVSASLENIIVSRQKKASSLGIVFDIIRLKHNAGLGIALQTGLKKVTTDFVVRMDSDDIAVPDRLLMAQAHLNENPDIDVLGTQISEFSHGPEQPISFRKVPTTHDDIAQRSKIMNPMNHMTVVMRRDAVLAQGGYRDCKYFEDYFLWLRLLNAGCKFCNLQSVAVHARVATLGDRRSGFAYARHEINFAKMCYRERMFSALDVVKFVTLRTPTRVMPKKLIVRLYQMLRKNTPA